MADGENKPNGYVREKLFNERTGNITTALNQLSEDVKEHTRIYALGQKDQDALISANCAGVDTACQRIDDHEGGAEIKRKDSSLRLARMAIILSIVSVAGTLLLGTVGVILKVMDII